MTYGKFVTWEPRPLAEAMAAKWPSAMREWDEGKHLALLNLFHNTTDYTLLRDGCVRIGGWEFSFREYCHRYWVKTRHWGILELWAPDKTTIRNALGSYHTIKIVEV